MPATLHLSRRTSPKVANAICRAFTGVEVTDDLKRRAEHLRMARIAASAPDRPLYALPLRYLIKHGFRNLKPKTPERYRTTLEYLIDYTNREHPDVATYERFLCYGLGPLTAATLKFIAEKGLDRFGPAGSTTCSDQVGAIVALQGDTNGPLPVELLRRVEGLYWQV